jgi:hypothetical protein
MVEIQWHQPDAAYAAGLVRRSEPWILGGALVGMGSTPAEAVTDLIGMAAYLLTHGSNALMVSPLTPVDLAWLASLHAVAAQARLMGWEPS